MELLLSPWFGGLSTLSILVMALITWGASRSYRRHNASPMGPFCDKEHAYPCMSTYVISLLYVVLTIAYVFVPPIIHDLFLL